MHEVLDTHRDPTVLARATIAAVVEFDIDAPFDLAVDAAPSGLVDQISRQWPAGTT